MVTLTRLKTLLLAGAVVLITTVASWGVVAGAQNVTQGYLSDQTLQNGMIVRLKPGDAKKVTALQYKDATDMFGVAVASTDAPVSLSDPTVKQTFVATFGKYDVLVSSQNGSIKAGDYITVSALDGVGMKSDDQQEVILGKALAGFNGTNDAESKVTLTDTLGNKREVGLGRISVDIGVAHNPTYAGDVVPGVPRFLSRLAGLVTNRPLTALRLYASLGVLALTIGVAGGIIYAGVRTSVTAVGRNPLAKKSIMRGLFSVAIVAFIVVTIGVVAVYLLLKI